MKEFNITGVCIPKMHYMADISAKLKTAENLVEKDKYFTINRARQYGKTTLLAAIENYCKEKYSVVKISFEGLDDNVFSSSRNFNAKFLEKTAERLAQNGVDQNIIDGWTADKFTLEGIDDLGKKITALVKSCSKEIILIIDEVDKCADNQLFLNFLGMLRNKYLDRQEGKDHTFKCVILAGVYDIKNLKLKLLPEQERKFNSPWNIAADFKADMSFNPSEIAYMLKDYERDHKTGMDIDAISLEIHGYTGGYPFLVSKICKTIEEDLNRDWTSGGVEEAVKLLLDEKNTLFDDLIKNLENNKDLYELIYDILVEGKKINFNPHNPTIDLGIIFGILSKIENCVGISSKVFELCVYNYMISKRETSEAALASYKYGASYTADGRLNMPLVLDKFQEIMHDEFRDKDSKFMEREGRLLFLCFLKPIINGKGFYFVEPETRMDNRMDIVVTFGGEMHIVELKIWHGDNYMRNAIEQLSGYIESKRALKGYLVSFNFNKNKEYTKEWIKFAGKEIYSVTV